jgi:hypothetical protein
MENRIIVTMIFSIVIIVPVFSASTCQILDENNEGPRFSLPLVKDYNNPPNPPVITGPVTGKIDVEYVYNVTVTDPDEDDGLLRLEVDFGDKTIEESCGCNRVWENGETVQISHKWKKVGIYNITGRVMDVHGVWSEWSDPLVVSMPKNMRSIISLVFSRNHRRSLLLTDLFYVSVLKTFFLGKNI